ncbi:hypothetical protein FKM82_006578 [Ascaphus truei]
MFTHVLGTKHRTAYLRKHHPEKSGGDKKYLKEICSDIERMYGRKSINECSECDPDEFMCNRELFEFLDSFKIINDTDVSFILKVTESFSNALVRYKKNSAEKKALPNAAGSNAPHSKINQPSIPSAHGFNRYPEPVTNYTPNQLFPSVSQFNPRGPITEPRFPLSVGSASNIPQGQWPNRMPPPYTAVPSPCFVPFPQGMPPPAMPPNVSSGFPPGFPLPKDEANFFASNKEHGGSRSDGYIEQYSCYKPSLQRNSRFKLDKIFD